MASVIFINLFCFKQQEYISTIFLKEMFIMNSLKCFAHFVIFSFPCNNSVLFAYETIFQQIIYSIEWLNYHDIIDIHVYDKPYLLIYLIHNEKIAFPSTKICMSYLTYMY